MLAYNIVRVYYIYFKDDILCSDALLPLTLLNWPVLNVLCSYLLLHPKWTLCNKVNVLCLGAVFKKHLFLVHDLASEFACEWFKHIILPRFEYTVIFEQYLCAFFNNLVHFVLEYKLKFTAFKLQNLGVVGCYLEEAAWQHLGIKDWVTNALTSLVLVQQDVSINDFRCLLLSRFIEDHSFFSLFIDTDRAWTNEINVVNLVCPLL